MDCRPKVRFALIKSALSSSRLPGLDYALNPYVGCQHGCLYCYAPDYTYISEARELWGKVIYVKQNMLEVLQREVLKKPKGTVGVGTITDAYQPLEAIYSLARSSIKTLLISGFKVSVQTKSSFVIRDIDIFMKYRSRVDIGFTITVFNDKKAKIIEPCSSPPSQRIRVLRALSSNGITVWAFLGPLILWGDIKDFISDVDLILAQISGYVDHVYYDRMRLKPNIFRAEEPLRTIFIRSAKNTEQLMSLVKRLCDKHGLNCIPAFNEATEAKLNI